MGVFPDFGGVGATGDLRTVIGALLMFVLIIAVLMLIVSAYRDEGTDRGLGCARNRSPRRSRRRLGQLPPGRR